jgi:hypothetical protein
MVPFVDALNHKPGVLAHFKLQRCPVKASIEQVSEAPTKGGSTSFVCVKAGSSFKKDEQVFINYGARFNLISCVCKILIVNLCSFYLRGNAELLTLFGFVLDNNEADVLTLPLDIVCPNLNDFVFMAKLQQTLSCDQLTLTKCEDTLWYDVCKRIRAYPSITWDVLRVFRGGFIPGSTLDLIRWTFADAADLARVHTSLRACATDNADVECMSAFQNEVLLEEVYGKEVREHVVACRKGENNLAAWSQMFLQEYLVDAENASAEGREEGKGEGTLSSGEARGESKTLPPVVWSWESIGTPISPQNERRTLDLLLRALLEQQSIYEDQCSYSAAVHIRNGEQVSNVDADARSDTLMALALGYKRGMYCIVTELAAGLTHLASHIVVQSE